MIVYFTMMLEKYILPAYVGYTGGKTSFQQQRLHLDPNYSRQTDGKAS